jgi:hypothetical protein
LRAASAGSEDILSTRVLAASSNQTNLAETETVVFVAFVKNDGSRMLRGVTALGYDTDQLVEIEPVEA